MKSKTKSLCEAHSAQISYICLSDGCVKNRLCCQKCARFNHFRHDIYYINKITKPLVNLSCNSHNENQKQNMAKLHQDYTAMAEIFNRIPALIYSTKKKLEDKFWSQYNWLMETFSERLVNQAYQNFTMGTGNQQYVEKIVENMKFLEKDSFGVAERVFKASKRISSEGVIKIADTFQRVQAAIDELMKFFEKYNFANIDNIVDQDGRQPPPVRNESQVRPMQQMMEASAPLQIKNPRLSLAYGELKKMQHPNNKQAVDNMMAQQKTLSIDNFESQTMKKIDELFQKYEKQNKALQKPKKSNLRKPTEMDMADSSQNRPQDNKNQKKIKIQNQGSEPYEESYSEYSPERQRVTHRVPVGKTLTKQAIMLTINTSPAQLREYVIIGDSQFDLDCLRLLANTFPKLEKLNYCWNFEEEGFKLQYEQVFMENEHHIQKKLTSTTELFELYAKLTKLENLQIDKIQTFNQQKVKIKNKNIRHLTIGEYLGEEGEPQKQFPQHLFMEVQQLKNLESLNIFNIRQISGPKIMKILQNNKQSLRSLWISQCSLISEQVMHYISTLKLKSFILDCLAFKCAVIMPRSIETFLMDNCTCDYPYNNPIKQLRNCQNIRNFSIYDSKFSSGIGNDLMEDLAANNRSMEYLNIGTAQFAPNNKIDNQSIKYLRTFPKLKWLNINHTKITLECFGRQIGLMLQMEKFGAIGLTNSTVQQKDDEIVRNISKNFPNLRVLLITFKYGVEKVNFESEFKKIKVLFLAEPDKAKNETKKLIKHVRKMLAKKGVKTSF